MYDNPPFHVIFQQANPLVYQVASTPKLECWWLSPRVMKWVNWLVCKLFIVADKRLEMPVKTHRINRDSIVGQITQQRYLIEMIYNRRVSRVLVGPAQMSLCAHEVGPLVFDVKLRLNGPNRPMIAGIPIEIVPWLDGVIALPKADR